MLHTTRRADRLQLRARSRLVIRWTRRAFGDHAVVVEVRIHEAAREFRDDRGAAVSPRPRREHDRADAAARRQIRRRRAPADRLGRRSRCRRGAADTAIPIGVQWNTRQRPPHRAAELARIRPDLSGVRGRRDLRCAFAEAWHGQTGRGGTVTTSETALPAWRHCIHLAPFRAVPRSRSDSDRALLVDWVEHFFVETFSHQRNDAAGERFVDNATQWVIASCSGTTAARR